MGLGAEFARVFASEGHDVILTARSETRMQTLKREIEGLHGARVHVIAKDLTDPQAPIALYDEVRAAGLEVDVLVNNAGFGLYGMFHETELQTELDMIQVNITALMHLTKLFVLPMVQRGRGRVINVASVAAFQPGPLQPVYYASKSFVLSFSEAIANELQGTGVTVTALCPGPTPTEFQARAGVTQARGLRLMMRVSPEAVVRAGYRGAMKGAPVVIPGALNNVVVFLERFLPRQFVTATVRRMQKNRD